MAWIRRTAGRGKPIEPVARPVVGFGQGPAIVPAFALRLRLGSLVNGLWSRVDGLVAVTLLLDQPFLALNSPPISAHRTVRPNHAMAGD